MKRVRAIFSMMMIAVMLFSTLGFTVSRHYCMGMLVSESYYLPSSTCGMEDNGNLEGENISSSCCEDVNLSLAGIEVIYSIKKSDHKMVYVASWPSADLHITPPTPHHIILPSTNSPPISPSGRHILVKIQRFLI